MASRSSRFGSRTGLTLIELVITVSLMALIVSIVVPSVSNITGINLKTAASKVAGSIRFTYDLAARKNAPFRLVFDIDERTYWVESSSDKFLLDREKTEVSDGALEQEEEEDEADTRRFVSRSYIEGGEMWHPKSKANFSSFAGPMTKKVTLPDNIHFEDVWVEHQDDRVTAGQAFLYFFPMGMTQRAVIHLGDDDQNVYTLVVEKLIGNVKIYPRYEEGPEE